MSLILQAQKDVQSITSNNKEFGVNITMIAPMGEVANIVGLHTKHHLGIDTEGNRVNSRNAHISVSEYELNRQYYPVRNSEGNVSLRHHKVIVKDSTGVEITYICDQWFPDETVGLIVIILGAWQN
jgi:hypothetical protein